MGLQEKIELRVIMLKLVRVDDIQDLLAIYGLGIFIFL